jgi:hypothetical protein
MAVEIELSTESEIVIAGTEKKSALNYRSSENLPTTILAENCVS